MRAGLFGFGLLLSLVSCAAITAPPQQRSIPALSATAAAPPTAQAAADTLLVELTADGARVGSETSPGDAASLLYHLQRLRGEAIVAETRVDNATPEALDNLLSAAEGAGFHRLRLHDARDEYELVLSSERATTHAMLELDDGQLLVSQLPPSEDHGPAWTPGNATDLAQAANWLRDQCRGKPCSLRLSRPRKLSLLDTIRQGVLVSRSTPDLELSMTPHVKFGATSVSGRLPPEAIQRTVREHFEIFKTCYEAGLARNDQLTGRVIARFVIGRDGKVSKVSDGGSDLPDTEVRDCVLKGFYQLEFPAPEGGIVTVIYPILLAPG